MELGSLLRKRASLYLAFVYGFVLIDFGMGTNKFHEAPLMTRNIRPQG